MYAISVSEPGGPEAMEWTIAADPVPGPGEVVIDVAASGVNRADLHQRQGNYPPPEGASDILGLECSGTISEVGAGVSGWDVGDRVCALLSGGGYAERVAVPADQLLPVPAGVGLEEAAALPEAACTVWSNIAMYARLAPGETFLVHGGGSGIGTHAIQVAAALGARVAVTAGTAEKMEACLGLGAAIAINYRETDFVTSLLEQTNGHGADVILDIMGSSYLDRNISALAKDGRIAVLGFQGGANSELHLARLMAKRGTIHAAGLRSRPVHGTGGKKSIIEEVAKHLWPMIASKTIRPVVHAYLPVGQAAAAHRLLDAPETVGKVVLTMN
ncbi:putative PIG3 family NAD(P)H quinone oxidoreductase [Arthrobacter globiformis]|uniref:NAD(P)H-quinone oxidoreductase n=1 Tax=Arthrobacter globiformis TaxID=1665 RepID=UPI00277ECE25|nr:NAD(P)H-quinone oxidoreductase [Arthrobacter globiformis]MDQ1060730.1 putative PIG3 family NAD(P)H quinone oxidoreductase [Arthrobacter globiformis]